MITILDTAICSENLGDQVIMDAVRRQLDDIFPAEYFVNIPTHDYLGPGSIRVLNASTYGIVGGTNLLSSNMKPTLVQGTFRHWLAKHIKPAIRPVNQWKLSPADLKRLHGNVILLGVGWWQYQPAPLAYTQHLFKTVLHPEKLHSVRDEYTRGQLLKAGINNVINTSCVTMWGLTPEHLAQIPTKPAKEVIATITFYKPNLKSDERLFRILSRFYKKIYLWVQGGKDLEYARSIPGLNVEFINPSLAALDRMLSRPEPIDYVGTRLHAGVRALQHKRRAFIVSVDNRATEIAKETGLPVIERKDMEQLKELIPADQNLRLNLPWENIRLWRDQFSKS